MLHSQQVIWLTVKVDLELQEICFPNSILKFGEKDTPSIVLLRAPMDTSLSYSNTCTPISIIIPNSKTNLARTLIQYKMWQLCAKTKTESDICESPVYFSIVAFEWW